MSEVLDELRAQGTDLAESTIRTHITSRMCGDSPTTTAPPTTISSESTEACTACDQAGSGMASDIVDRIVEQNLGVYRAAPSRLQEDVSQEAQVASDYRGALGVRAAPERRRRHGGHATQRDCVAFLVTDDALWMANSGRALTDADVQGLCGLGASSKVDADGTKRASIGHKGLGFKSVLEITDEPAVFSRTHSFRLGEREARPARRRALG